MSIVLQAEILATGDELLSGATADTNGAWAAARLRESGALVSRMTTVGDRLQDLCEGIRQAADRADFVLVSGGLGPTEDDRTAEAAAAAAGLPLVRNEEALAHTRSWFERHRLPMTANNEKQAMLPAGCDLLDNSLGTAVGFTLTLGSARLFFLPGVPHEYRRMLQDQVLPRVATEAARRGADLPGLRILRLYGIGESRLATELAGLDLPAGLELGYRPTWPELHLRLYFSGAGDSAAALDRAEAAIRERVGRRIYGTGERGMAATVGSLLEQRGWMLAVAESCTGGLLGATCTDVAGASAWFAGGCITYSNACKTALLGVPPALFESAGAVSREVAEAMAAGARERTGAAVALSATGVAGPDGGTPEKPVGLVWIGLATADGVSAREVRLRGDRERVRLATVWAALERARRLLLGIAEE